MKRIIAVLLSILVSLGITMGAGFALADEDDHEHTAGEFEVTLSSDPKFPVMGEEAELTFTISHDGSPEEGLMLMVMLAKMEGDDHGHGAEEMEMAMEADEHQEADEHTEAEHTEADEHVEGDEHAEAEGEAMELITLETSPGVYVAKYTFGEDGKYLVTTHIGTHAEGGADEHSEFTVAVRGSPVDWQFVAVLAAVPVFLAMVVAVRNIIRREW